MRKRFIKPELLNELVYVKTIDNSKLSEKEKKELEKYIKDEFKFIVIDLNYTDDVNNVKIFDQFNKKIYWLTHLDIKPVENLKFIEEILLKEKIHRIFKNNQSKGIYYKEEKEKN